MHRNHASEEIEKNSNIAEGKLHRSSSMTEIKCIFQTCDWLTCSVPCASKVVANEQIKSRNRQKPNGQTQIAESTPK